jgi:uncharacterized protein YutE (UPF0331/DUF86 family)
MTRGKLSKRVVADRLAWVDRMLHEIRSLPIGDHDLFFSDRRNLWSAESCLRRCLEALHDLGRHILAKGFGTGVSEYKEIAQKLQEHSVLTAKIASTLRILGGYRNRLVHFYHEVSQEELFQICARELADIEAVADGIRKWIRANERMIDEKL